MKRIEVGSGRKVLMGVVALTLGAPSWSAGQFSPQDLSPDFYVESVQTFSNPTRNSDCVAPEEPNYCCTGFGTGTCDEPVASFRVADCPTRNLDCTGNGTPHACCTGFQAGNCCYEEDDQANGFRGNSYCPASVCPDGCVNQWIDQSGHKSFQLGHPVTGRTFEQDDLEKPCLKESCINGHPCVTGHPKWIEPGYLSAQQPKQDATLEIEPSDRTGPLLDCPGAFYLAQLVRIVPQSEDHRLLAGYTKYLVDENVLQFRPPSGAVNVSVANVLPLPGKWYLIELERVADLTLALRVDGQDVTASPAPTHDTSIPWSHQNLCDGKSCDALDNQEFQGEGALLFFRCGPPLTSEEQASFRNYVLETFTAAVFADGFETGDTSLWSRAVP